MVQIQAKYKRVRVTHASMLLTITGTCFVPGSQILALFQLYFKRKERTFTRLCNITSLEERISILLHFVGL